MSALSPNLMQRRELLKKPRRVRDNNCALQVRLRLDGRDHFINRLGSWDDSVAQARGQAICAEIWRNSQQRDLRYVPDWLQVITLLNLHSNFNNLKINQRMFLSHIFVNASECQKVYSFKIWLNACRACLQLFF